MTGTGTSRRYVICAPQGGGSAGVRVLYALCDELRRRGCSAAIYPYGRKARRSRCADTVTSVTPEMRENDIVVYSETVWGNPLGFRNVVRWVLNVPGRFGGERSYHQGELVVAWLRQYADVDLTLRLDLVDRTLFYDDGGKKTTDAVFVYKGGRVRRTPELAGLPVITMTWPKTREELGALLRRTRVLFSHDANTSLVEEAEACGAKVKIVTKNGTEDFVPSVEPYSPERFEREISACVQKTQAMGWHGDINRRGRPVHGLRPFYWICFLGCALLIRAHVPGNWLRHRNYFMQMLFIDD